MTSEQSGEPTGEALHVGRATRVGGPVIGAPAEEAAPAPRQRSTKQRSAVAEALDSLEEFVSAQRLHEIVRDRGERVGLATVYRALQGFTEAGEVDSLRTDDGEILYRRCARAAHHHHLVCRNCRATIEVEGPGVETWADAVAAQHGFTDVDHVLELTGLCSRCA